MKLRELIVELQRMEKINPELNVAAQMADLGLNELRPSVAVFCAAELNLAQGCCVLTFGTRERDPELYASHMRTIAEQNKR